MNATISEDKLIPFPDLGLDPQYAEMLADTGRLLATEYLEVIKQAMQAHPRSQQKRIGPSEIGMECTRALIHKLAGDPTPPRDPAWKAAVGTACHLLMENYFDEAPTLLPGQPTLGKRWFVEQEISVGPIGEIDITGHSDLWDEVSHAVIDHKFVSLAKIRNAKANGPGQQYRMQAHLYGKGFEDAGKTVDLVMIAFMPRDAELDESYRWFEPYNRAYAQAGLDRANRLYNAIQTIGTQKTLERYPEKCDSLFCSWCSPVKPGYNRDRPATPPGFLDGIPTT